MPILIGIVIGRIGCLLAGLQDVTYGNPTSLPWGVDFGDGIPRHPTQFYDKCSRWRRLRCASARALAARVPGLQFKLMLFGYLLWRVLHRLPQANAVRRTPAA